MTSSCLCKGSIGDLDGGEDTTPGDLSLSGEEGGASDQEDSAGGDGSSPPPFAPLYNEGEEPTRTLLFVVQGHYFATKQKK